LSNVHVCTGHGANGLLLGPYSAALVAAGVIEPASDAVVPYAVTRVFAP
jgi:glycine/D-amino acid oxidase-like deaminating enzyme